MFASNMEDMLGALLGVASGSSSSMGRYGQPQQARRGRNDSHTLPVTLADLYNGKSVQLDRQRTVLCSACSNDGKRAGGGQRQARHASVCTACRGSGVRLMVRQVGMFVQQMQTTCTACHGTGMRSDAQTMCDQCGGRRLTRVDATMTVAIERGMAHGQKLTYEGMADENEYGIPPGDLVIVLQQVKHDTFVRNGDDLHMRKRLTLVEALCGFQFKLQHLDGRELVVRRARGKVTAPGSSFCVYGEGMPVLSSQASDGDGGGQGREGGRRRGGGGAHADKYGNLIIEFEVDYPNHLQEAQVAVLRESLPPPRSHDVTASEAKCESDVCSVERHELSELRSELAKEAQEEVEDADDEQPRFACAQQ